MNHDELERLERAAHLLPPHYFVPGRPEAADPTELHVQAEQFRERLRKVSPDLDLSWHPLRGCWQVWCRDWRVRSPWCKGWRRLFLVVDPEGNYRPLDRRTLAELALRDANYQGSATEALERIRAEAKADAERAELREDQELRDEVEEWFDSHRISVTTIPGEAGKRSGRKFADHWSE